jgi:hypothetical protein
MLKHADPESTLVGFDTMDELAEYAELDELELVKLELRELREELGGMREKLDEALGVVTRRDRLNAAAHARRQRGSRGRTLARAILRVMVAVFTLGGTIAGVGVGAAVIHIWGTSAYALVACGVFGLAVALVAWLAASLAAIVLETADAVRDLP